MASNFFSRLFGGGSKAPAEAQRGEASEYKGYSVTPAPQPQGSQWITAGFITKTFPEGTKEQNFIRADMFATRDEAEACALRKGQQIIDEQGDKLFKG